MEETIGWNYDHLKSNGKNVYIFRDTNHASPDVETRIADEAGKQLEEKIYSTIYIEGWVGKVTTGFNYYGNHGSEAEMIESLDKNGYSSSPCYRLIFRYKNQFVNSNYNFFGVENKRLSIKSQKILSEILFLYKKLKMNDSFTEDRYSNLRLKRGFSKFFKICNKRSKIAVKSILRNMDKCRISQAGLIVGDLHYEGIVSGFESRQVGYASYYPGKFISESDDALDWITRNIKSWSLDS